MKHFERKTEFTLEELRRALFASIANATALQNSEEDSEEEVEHVPGSEFPFCFLLNEIGTTLFVSENADEIESAEGTLSELLGHENIDARLISYSYLTYKELNLSKGTIRALEAFQQNPENSALVRMAKQNRNSD